MKRLASVLPVLVLVSLVGRAAAPAGPASDAVGFRGDARGRGVAPGRVPQRRPRVLWSVKTDGPIRSTPLMAGSRVFFGSGDGKVRAVDARTGGVLWTASTGGAVEGSPALAAGSLVVASRDRILRALDPGTGKERWRFAFGDDLPFRWGWDFYLSSAVGGGDALFVGAGDGNVYSLDARTGHERWRFATKDRVRGTPALADGVVYVGSFDGFLYALDAKTGKERWRAATEGVSYDLEKFGFDRRSIQGSPAVSGDTVLVGSRDGRLYAFERATGARRWAFDHKVSWVASSPAVEDGVVWVGSSDGLFVNAVDVASGKELWRFDTGINVLASPLLVSGTLLVAGEDGTLWALDAKGGRELWRWHAGESIHASPVAKDGLILAASGDGVLTALGGDLDARAISAERVVFADSSAPWRWQKKDGEIAAALVREGWRRVDAAALVKLLEERTASKAPSAVVIAGGNVPPEIEGDGTAEAPVRKYLEAGGRIVWLGGPPFAIVLDPKTHQPVKFDAERTERILGVKLQKMWIGEEPISATALGSKAGLPAWWLSDVSFAPAPRMEVLGADGEGRASLWRVGFANGGAFVFVSGRDKSMPSLPVLLAAAEDGLE